MDYTKRDHGCVSVHTAVPLLKAFKAWSTYPKYVWNQGDRPDAPLKNYHKGKQLAPQAVLLPNPLDPQDLVGAPRTGRREGRKFIPTQIWNCSTQIQKYSEDFSKSFLHNIGPTQV